MIKSMGLGRIVYMNNSAPSTTLWRSWVAMMTAFAMFAPNLGLAGTPGVFPLSSSQLIFAAQDWGALGVDKSVEGNKLNLGGKSYARGFGTHANSELVFNLADHFEHFEAWVGVDDEMRSFGKSSVIFKVLADERELFNSGVMRNDTPPRHVSVPLSGVENLSLVVTDAGDGISGDHADWVEPLLYKSNGTPNAKPKPARTAYEVSAPGLQVRLSAKGEVVSLGFGPTHRDRMVRAGTQLLDCHTKGTVVAAKLPDGGMEFARTLTNREQRVIFLRERFTPATASIHWEVEVRNAFGDWSAPVITMMEWPDAQEEKIWSAWQDPLNLRPNADTGDADMQWNDPLLARPFSDGNWNYGEPPGGGYEKGDIITLPMVTVLAENEDLGLSLVESPEDPLVEMKLMTTAQGRISLIRSGQRFSADHSVRWAMDLIPHRGNWRPSLAWMSKTYPGFFDPPNPHVQAMAGTAAYTGEEKPVDVERLKRMAFRILWKLSDDYAYMGLFLPPLTNVDARWERTSDQGDPPGYKPQWTSFRRLNDFARYLRENGFYLLDYFNTTEFGKSMTNVEVSPGDLQNPNLWKNPSAYLKARMPNAVIRPAAEAWQGGWAVDPGDPAYRDYLLEQARRHLVMVPDSAGLCIDRADYLSHFNMNADDGASWHNGQPARALVQSWRELMERLGPMMHEKDKVIFCNLMDARLDLTRQLDGIYDEFGNRPAVLNGAALLCIHKPLLVWTSNDDPLSDAFFQRHLYLGAFPTAPYPLNNHCIQPSPERDRWYLDYGPLFDLLRGKNWVLEAYCVEVAGRAAKANLFQVTGGWVAPVVFGGTNTIVTLKIHNVPGLKKTTRCEIFHPGAGAPAPAWLSGTDEDLEVQVPLKRGCAMVRLLAPD
jgi:hypothetical protein